MNEGKTKQAPQRRKESVVDGLGVIETGLPSRARTGRTPGSADSFLTQSSVISANTSKQLGILRTNRTLPRFLPGHHKSSQDSTTSTWVNEGRAKVLKCEVKTDARLCSGIGIGNATINTRTILHPMRFDIPAGSLTAIFGTAQSGKSTLMKFLAGCLDKNMIYEGLVNLPGSSSYLPEDTYLHRFYTPRTYLQHYDHMNSSNNFNGESRDDNATTSEPNDGTRRTRTSSFLNNMIDSHKTLTDADIEKLLDSLRIDNDRRDVIVGDAFKRGLNVGEQRRLELGLIVLSRPDILFLEDPVAGLDSETSLHIMEFLKGYIANTSRRVVVTLNRPSPFVWNLIDNVVLLSKGHMVYEGPRFDMESFFAFHKKPTPKRFSPLEHYLAVINNFRSADTAVNWGSAFRQWQEEADEDEGDDLADDIETCFPTAIPDVVIPQISLEDGNRTKASKVFQLMCCCCGAKFSVLLQRYLSNMVLNPGMLMIRFVMYTCLSLLLGLLFYDLESDDSYQAVNSRAALLFYTSSFYIFMVVAVLPFLAHDKYVRDKEVLNGFYHPVTHHFATVVACIPSVLILSLMITALLVGLVKLQNGVNFFIIFALALWCAESYALLMSLCVRNYIIAIVLLAGIFGVSMPLQGFMLVPSKFPNWLRWTYLVPFHTYTWRSLMYNEFIDVPSGMEVLESYEIQDTNLRHDMVVLFFYGLIIQLACLLVIYLGSSSKLAAHKVKES